MRDRSIQENFSGTYMLDTCINLENRKGYGHNLDMKLAETDFKALYRNTQIILEEKDRKQKLFNEERVKYGEPNLDIPSSFRSMANTTNNIVYDIKKKSFANTCKAEITKYNVELENYVKAKRIEG